ncbi:MAG: hypothetical protein LC800_05385 [Acidobacteria bacterium]|nr:hypothetical protein [Acidobacteriota bacterium]
MTPTLSINDVSQAEGNAGASVFTFTVSLSTATHGGITYDICTADGTAQDGSAAGEDGDYTAKCLTGQSIPDGTQSAQFTVNVNGDAAGEPNETFFVNATNVVGATVSDGQGQGTIVNDDPIVAAIHVIQGSGTSSPFAGSLVQTSGVVTLLKTGVNTGEGAASGFFIQTPDGAADSDPNTSEGLFVFTSSVPTVSVGDNVTVAGTAIEFNGMTEISPVTSISVNSTGNGIPTPVTLTTTILDPTAPPSQPQLEKYEGMRLAAAALRTVAPNDGFYDVDTVLNTVARPFREPGIEISNAVPPDPQTGTPDCCIPRMSAVPVPVPTGNEFTVAGFNIENFNGGATQKQKASLAIRDVMRLPDIIGHVEILNLVSLQALAAQVNADTVAAGQPDPQYTAHLIPAPAGGTQNLGFLVKSSRVAVDSVTQERAAETFVNPVNNQTETLHDRPPLVLRARINPAGVNLPVIAVVNHLRSFIDIELVTGEGVRVREKRKKQAESTAGLLQELQTNNPGTPVVSVGDYNAFQFSSGYDDSLSVLKGTPTADDQIVVDQSPDVVNPNFFNLIDDLPAEERYTFIFEGTPQVLDHVLVNTIARARNTRFAVARNNSDFPEAPPALFATNAARPERNSDHDMPVAYFNLNGAALEGKVLISELRFRGPTGPTNEFVELYNNTDADITVNSTDGSAGWSVAMESDAFEIAGPNAPAAVASLFVIPNGTVIPARSHYLAANSTGYDLQTTAEPDDTFTGDMPDDAGVALFTTSVLQNYDLNTRLDAAGAAGAPPIVTQPAATNPLFYEGGGLDPVFANNNYSYVRKLSSGRPQDTDDNSADFITVSTDPAALGGDALLGAPGPESLESPIQLTGKIKSVLLDSLCSGTGTALANPLQATSPDGEEITGCQNRARDTTPLTVTQPNTSAAGTLFIRRRFINTTSQPVTRLRFRVVDITTTNGVSVPPGTADLRLLSAGDVTITTTNGQNVEVKGLTLEQPPAQPLGGGYNSTVAAGTINTGTPLLPGTSIAVQFRLGVQQAGTFRFFVNVEGLLDDSLSPVRGVGKTRAGRGEKP